MFEKEIARGAALLDEKVPGWRNKVNTGTLKMINGTTCLACQACGTYYLDACKRILHVEPYTEAAEHGLTLPQEDVTKDVSWNQLTKEWVEYLNKHAEPKSMLKPGDQAYRVSINGKNVTIYGPFEIDSVSTTLYKDGEKRVVYSANGNAYNPAEIYADPVAAVKEWSEKHAN